MIERRDSQRYKVILGGVASTKTGGETRDCVIHNLSETGANVEFKSGFRVPDDIGLSIPHKGRSYVSKIIWRRANTVGVAFQIETPVSDLEERLRISEQKKRVLQRQINKLLGGD